MKSWRPRKGPRLKDGGERGIMRPLANGGSHTIRVINLTEKSGRKQRVQDNNGQTYWMTLYRVELKQGNRKIIAIQGSNQVRLLVEMKIRSLLVELYGVLAALTWQECSGGSGCKTAFSCCSAITCQSMSDFARTRWGVQLKNTGHPNLPLMGESGCVAAPHLRPLCSVHVCCVASHGCKPEDEKWTDQYFDIRDRLNELEMRLDEHLNYHGRSVNIIA